MPKAMRAERTKPPPVRSWIACTVPNAECQEGNPSSTDRPADGHLVGPMCMTSDLAQKPNQNGNHSPKPASEALIDDGVAAAQVDVGPAVQAGGEEASQEYVAGRPG